MTGATDRVLWERASAGDADAFAELFDRHARAIYNFCFRRTADWSAAEDLTASVFLEAWRRRRSLRLVDESVLPWLYVVAMNLIRNRRRRLRRAEAALARLDPAAPGPDPCEDVAGRLDDAERMRRINRLLERLPTREQAVLVLCLWQGLSYQQAAAALDVPVGTVRSRLARARARLRLLAGDDGCVAPGPTLETETGGGR